MWRVPPYPRGGPATLRVSCPGGQLTRGDTPPYDTGSLNWRNKTMCSWSFPALPAQYCRWRTVGGRNTSGMPCIVLVASEASFLVRSMALHFAIYIIESISRNERDAPLTLYITNAGISRVRNTITHFKHHHRVLRLVSNQMSVYDRYKSAIYARAARSKKKSRFGILLSSSCSSSSFLLLLLFFFFFFFFFLK